MHEFAYAGPPACFYHVDRPAVVHGPHFIPCRVAGLYDGRAMNNRLASAAGPDEGRQVSDIHVQEPHVGPERTAMRTDYPHVPPLVGQCVDNRPSDESASAGYQHGTFYERVPNIQSHTGVITP